MPRFHIPMIAEVECASIEEARKLVYSLLERFSIDSNDGKLTTVFMADDSQKDRAHHRLVFLHPEDVDSSYDAEAYEKAIKSEEE